MPEQPDFLLPVRDPELPAGNFVGADSGRGLAFAWTYEPEAESSVSTVEGPFVNAGRSGGFNANATFYNGRLYVVVSDSVNARIIEMTAEGAVLRAVTLESLGINPGLRNFIGVSAIASDSSGLIVQYNFIPNTGGASGGSMLARIPYSLVAGSAVSITASTGSAFLGRIAIVDGELWAINNTNRIDRYTLTGNTVGSRVGTVSLSSTISSTGGLEVTDNHIVVLSRSNILTFTRSGAVDPLIGTIALGSTGRGVAFDGFGVFYSVTGTAELSIARLAGLPIQSFSLRRRTGPFEPWQYWNGEGTGALQWRSTETPQPASLLQDEGIIEEPVTRRFRLTLGDNWDSGTNQHQFQVRNRDQRDEWSPWSDSIRVQPGSPLGANIITPDTDDGDLSAEFNPQWLVTGGAQGYYRVTTRSLGRLLQRTVIFVTSRASHIWGTSGADQLLTSLPNEPDEGATLDIEVEVWSAQLVRTVARRRATVRYLPPVHAFNLNALEESDHAAVLVTWTNPALRGANPPSSRVELWRRVEGENPLRIHNDTEPLTNNADTDAAFTDYWAPLERLLEYRVLTYGARNQTDDTAPWFE